MGNSCEVCSRKSAVRLQAAPEHRSRYGADTYKKRSALVELAKQGDVKLIKGAYLVKLHEQSSEPVKRRQELPHEAFVPWEELQDERMEIVALSYCWCTQDHPDPARFHLPIVAKMAKAMMAGRYVDGRVGAGKNGTCVEAQDLRREGFAFGDTSLAVFWDYMSLPQVFRTDDEDTAFKHGLETMSVWYGSQHVTKWILTDLPEGASRASYQSSGWACFEREVANIISPPGRMLTLPAGTSAHKLLSQKDRFEAGDFINIAFQSSQVGKRSAAMLPDSFDMHVDELTFSKAADKDVLKPRYREAFHSLLDGATEMNFIGYRMSTDVAEESIQVVLARCHHVEKLDLSNNPEWEGELERLVGGIAAAPCAKSLTGLHLFSCCKVRGDLQRLAPLVNLQEIDLSKTQVSGDVHGLATLVNLQRVNVSETAVAGNAQGLAPLVKLRELNLAVTDVSGDVEDLVPLVNLRMLIINGSQLEGDIGALQEQLPNLYCRYDAESDDTDDEEDSSDDEVSETDSDEEDDETD
mmetsp:Transcript_44726/g.103433  ORF Transcript_44726/g.103433 Transcript_44726/m.103433 type:complete len:524 (+) Transcript_44726:72-1643(+)